jgi:hypothetical protein
VKLRHAAALAFLGWYLMIAPGKGDKFLVNAPLSKWRQLGEFDSAAECDKQRSEWMATIIRLSAPGTAEGEWARCIASDDPRLKGK